jgi:hypothetical protein
MAGVFALLALVQIVLVATLRVPFGNYEVAKANERSQAAYQTAMAGVEYGSYVVELSTRVPAFDPTVSANWPDLDGDAATTGDIPAFDFGTVTSLTITANGGNYDVAADGRASGVTRRATATVNQMGSVLNFD